MAKKHTIQTIKNPTELPWKSLYQIWHLHRGGLTAAEIADITGFKVHGQTLYSLMETLTSLIKGLIKLGANVRCKNCGGCLTELPCYWCQRLPPSYKVIDDNKS